MDPFGHPAGAVAARVLHRCGIGQPPLLLVTVMVTVTQSVTLGFGPRRFGRGSRPHEGGETVKQG